MTDLLDRLRSDNLEPGTPVTLEFGGTQFVGLVEDASALTSSDGITVTIYAATNADFAPCFPTGLWVPQVFTRIRSNRLRWPSSAESDRLIRGKAEHDMKQAA